MESNNEIVLKIARIAFKSETFCTGWNGKLYCVDVFEDAEERTAWLYEANTAIKTLMWGEKIEQTPRDEFLDMVFSSLPDYIEDYEEEMETYEEACELRAYREDKWEVESSRDDWDEEE